MGHFGAILSRQSLGQCNEIILAVHNDAAVRWLAGQCWSVVVQLDTD